MPYKKLYYKKGGDEKNKPITTKSRINMKLRIFGGTLLLFIKLYLKFYIIIFILSYTKKFFYSFYIELCKAWQFLKSFFKTLANPGRWEIPIFNYKIPNFWSWITAAMDLIMFFSHLLVALGYFVGLCLIVLPINFVLSI